MSYPINYPTPQGANIQIFNVGGATSDWVKPQGASFVWFTLIGAGGGGGFDGAGSNGTGGGGSGAVTNFMGPAFLMPDVLRVFVGKGGTYGVDGTASTIIYQQKDGVGYTLLTAAGGFAGDQSTTAGAGGAASVSNYFSCMGFFQSVAGQAGSDGAGTQAGVNQTASATTFLSGGAGGSGGVSGTGGSVTANYGYSLPLTPAGGTVEGYDGFFYIQPIIVGLGGSGGTTNSGARFSAGGDGGVGCGAGGSGENEPLGGKGGNGLVVIITW